MGNTASACGRDDPNEHLYEGDYKERIGNYSRAYKGNKDDPRSNPYKDSEHKKNEREILKDQYQRPMPANSMYDKYDPYKIDQANSDIQDSANFYPRSHLTSTIAFDKIELDKDRQALAVNRSEKRMLREANYQSVDHTPTLPVKRTDKMYRYSQDALLTLAKYPSYRLALPADASKLEQSPGEDYTLKLKTAEKGRLEGSNLMKPATSHLESDRKRGAQNEKERSRFSEDEKGKFQILT